MVKYTLTEAYVIYIIKRCFLLYGSLYGKNINTCDMFINHNNVSNSLVCITDIFSRWHSGYE